MIAPNLTIRGFRTNGEGLRRILDFLESKENQGYSKHEDIDGNVRHAESFIYYRLVSANQIIDCTKPLYRVNLEKRDVNIKNPKKVFQDLTSLLAEVYL